MRLERLEISGFKSFSDRSELAFDQGVTAIVGPNGCGKSNVADAITWVLGEQSAKSLRGDRMEDVIFSGSDARRPGGAAEVRLRLSGLPTPPRHPDDTSPAAGASERTIDVLTLPPPAAANGHGPDENAVRQMAEAFTRDVEVTRRLFRSGESEYLIDGAVCRLRDVHELLMDTGLGAKAYSIIEQGKIGMILSSRPADRRQLIEEAAGITKYKSRRRAAELKLEAAQQNLTRIDDIVFEVEKQRGALKRQAAKARRYTRLRDELRRWEKVLLARRYRELSQAIDLTRAELAGVREREAGAAAHVAEVESDLARLRIEQAEADRRAASVREDAHTRELGITRRQQQLALNRQQVDMLDSRAEELAQELAALEGRHEPAAVALKVGRAASADAEVARARAAERLAVANDDHARALGRIESHESDVESTRETVFGVINAATALRHALQHAAHQQDRVGESLLRLDLEQDDVRRETDGVASSRAETIEALARAREVLADLRRERAAREAEVASARARHEELARDVRGREHAAAAAAARLASLEELAGSRADFSDAARMVLIQANGHVGQQGAVADYLEVDGRYERAVEACLGDLLQHVIVDRHEQAEAGLSLVRECDAGRCGFVVVDPDSNGFHPRETLRRPGIVPVADVLRIQGPHQATLTKVVPEAYVAETFEHAVAMSRETSAPVATLAGDVLRGPHLVSGGAKVESRGILGTRREIKELKERLAADRELLVRLSGEVNQLELAIAATSTAAAALQDQQHQREMVIVALEAQVERADAERDRLCRKIEIIQSDRGRFEQERTELDGRRAEAESAIAKLAAEQQQADDRLARAQQLLAEARQLAADLGATAAEAGAAHATLVERALSTSAESARLAEVAKEIDERTAARREELDHTSRRRQDLFAAIDEDVRSLDHDIIGLETMRDDLRAADENASRVRAGVEAQDHVIRAARRALEEARASAADLEVRQARAEADLSYLEQACVDTVQASLSEVLAAVGAMEAAGEMTPDAAAIAAEEPDPESEDAELPQGQPSAGAEAAPVASMTAEDAIVRLRTKIDRLGPVNMIAIEQFDELEQRHAFLATQRRDLVDSIAQTSEAISRIDETTRVRFAEAFTAIQQNFSRTFATLFGGGRAGLTLLDESDPLDSGIDIVASPPGKRLQSVQLLSGGEKALTAIALMFAIFEYKPSPFCLLDEIDAPLDDANVGRFVDMLRGMLDRTQFILITHNRRTMEIADRLYGVTMEEPGVSKLISVQLH
jgi:chromosome segregation protein